MNPIRIQQIKMKVSPVDLKSLGIDPLRGKAKEGTGWPENNRDPTKWDWTHYCLACHLEVKKPYICQKERELNRSIYSPTNPNWAFNRPPSLRPRCPQCKEFDKLITKQQRIDALNANIAAVHNEHRRLKKFEKKWKLFRKHNCALIFQNSNCVIPRDSLDYRPSQMWQCHINLLQYIEDCGGYFMPRSESTKEDLDLIWELDHKWRQCRKQNEFANLMLNSGNAEMKKASYVRAGDYYNKAIRARIDRTDLYLARSNFYFVTGRYEAVILDTTVVIKMIDEVHSQLKQSGTYVEAYYNRARAKKLSFLSKFS